MANKRIKDLPAAASSVTGDFVAIDGTTTRKITVEDLLDDNLVAIKGLTSAADKGIQFTGAGVAATYDLTAAGKALLDDANAAAQRATLGLAIGTNIQPYDANLTTWAGKTAPTGAAVGISDAQTLTNKTIDGGDNTLQNIPNASLDNFSVTIAGHSVDLGGTQAIAVDDLSAIADGSVIANVSGASAAPAAKTITQLLDGVIGSTQGAIIYRNSTAWTKLDPGTSGHFLKTLGASANPAWAAVPGGGDMLAATYDPTSVGGDAFARANHTGTQATATIDEVSAVTNAGRKFYNRIVREKNIFDYLVDDPNTTPGAVNDAWDALVTDLGSVARATAIFPQYDYQLTRGILAPVAKSIEIVCDTATRLFAHSTGNWGTGTGESPGMIGSSDDTQLLANFRWRGGLLIGGGNVPYGMYLPKCIHSNFDEPDIMGCTGWALRLSGYSNTIKTPKLHENTGGGLYLSGSTPNNNVNVEGGIIYANDGIGARVSDGWGINLSGLGIEANKIAGLMSWNVRSLFLGNGAYLEQNGSVGYGFTTGGGSPENLTVKTDIMLLSGSAINLTAYDSGTAARSVVIDGCTFTPYGSVGTPGAGAVQDCLIFAAAMENLRITNNDIYDTTAANAMVGTYNNNGVARASSVVIEGNDLNNVVLLGTGAGSTASFSTAHKISNRFEKNVSNYASQVKTDYTAIVGTTGAFTDTGAKYGRFDVWQITPGDTIWGIDYSLTGHAELLGKYVWFGLNYQRDTADTNIRLDVNGKFDNSGTTLSGTSGGLWEQRSVLYYVDPSATSIFIGFSYVGAAGTIKIACPMLTVIGNSLADVMRST